MSHHSTIYRRRTIRRYTSRPVEAATIEMLLDAAAQAPSPHNRRPWRFAIIAGEARRDLARVMGERWRVDLAQAGAPADRIAREVARSFQRITSAPAAILACLCMKEMVVYPDARRAEAERWMAGQAVAAATQNILLRATELDLGACWMCAPLFCQDAVVQALGLPPDWSPQALITLGYSAKSDDERIRQNGAGFVKWISSCDDIVWSNRCTVL